MSRNRLTKKRTYERSAECVSSVVNTTIIPASSLQQRYTSFVCLFLGDGEALGDVLPVDDLPDALQVVRANVLVLYVGR